MASFTFQSVIKITCIILLCVMGWSAFSFTVNHYQIDATAFSTEHGFIEILSIILVFLAAIISLVVFYKTHNRNWVLYSLWMILFGLRELDLHKAFTTDSILKSRFYLSTDTPIIEKCIGAGFIFILISMVLVTLNHFWNQRVRLIKLSFTTTEVYGFSGFGLIVMSKLIDSLFRIFPYLEIYKSDLSPSFQLVEEGLEVSGAFLFLYCAIYFFRSKANNYAK